MPICLPGAASRLGAWRAVLAGLVIGIPCLRLKGTYLALTTLAFPIILMGIVFALPNLTGGELGVSGLDPIEHVPSHQLLHRDRDHARPGTVMWKITDSNTGIIFHAIREDELAVKAAGINTTRYKLMAFCLSGFLPGSRGASMPIS
jgi:branched-chain amino acid transport system permease protein